MNSGSDPKHSKTGVAIFASGAGTNAENCFKYFQDHPSIYICLVVSNKFDAGVLIKAEKFKIPVRVFRIADWEKPTEVIAELKRFSTDYILLAGYLALVPPALTEAFGGRIFNIHPALLPKFGGKGMFGLHVHHAVIAQGEKETGITIHEVNNAYDEGNILFQKKIEILPDDTPESIEIKVRKLEYYYLPRVIESLILKKYPA